MKTAKEFLDSKEITTDTFKNMPLSWITDLMDEFSQESNKELLSKIEDLKLTIEALEDHVRDKTIERDKAQKMNERLLEALQNYDGVFNSPISRRKIDSDMANECRKFGRDVLELLQSTTQEKGIDTNQKFCACPDRQKPEYNHKTCTNCKLEIVLPF